MEAYLVGFGINSPENEVEGLIKPL